MGRLPKKIQIDDESNITCVCCGNKRKNSEFYMSKWSRIYNINEKRVPVCKTCLQKLIDEFTKQYDEMTALKIACAVLDVPFDADIYANMIKDNSPFNIGSYMRQMQLNQKQNKSFATTIIDKKLETPDIKEIQQANIRWSKKDKQNMNYVISTVGYDPFDSSGMSEDDRRYCYNTLARYCDIEDIKDDAHKMLGCIQITNSQLQVKKIDEMISSELTSSADDNENKIKSLTESKKKLQDIIAKIAADNNISSNFNKNSGHGKNTLSQKMKDMLEDGYEAICVNLYDIKTSDAIKQVADISNQSIMEQLNFDANDYSEMVKEQRELIVKLQEKCDELEEMNRNLKNENNDYKYNKKR